MAFSQSELLLQLHFVRSPSFSLGTALMWLGHDCPGNCPAAADEQRAEVWYRRLPMTARAGWTQVLVEVDFLDAPRAFDAAARLLAQVNRCVGVDHLRVRRRSADDRTAFLAALSARRVLLDARR